MTIEEIRQQLEDARNHIRFLQNRKVLIYHGMRSDYTSEQCDLAILAEKQLANRLAEKLKFMEDVS